MARVSKLVFTALASFALLLVSGAARAQETTKTTEIVHFEVISVDGNHVVYRSDKGVKEATLPPDFKLDVDGKEITVADLKPGMKGTAHVVTKVTTTPVTVTEVRQAEVLNVSGNAIIVRGKNGPRKFTIEDVRDKNISIMKDGKPVQLSELHVGDRLTATIITRHPPQVVTERTGSASVAGEPAPAPAAEAPKPAEKMAEAAPAPAPAPAEEHKKKLPKTGSDLPLLALLGGLSLATGFGLTTLRRSRTAR
jgi:LPXTG-motif cell wall-anchored protein